VGFEPTHCVAMILALLLRSVRFRVTLRGTTIEGRLRTESLYAESDAKTKADADPFRDFVTNAET
jgi:hypothetical protein